MSRISVVLPAHQEEGGIVAAIESLRAQTVVPDRIVVSVDNCTDRTAELAEGAGALVYITQGNTDRKAGALNQALGWLSETLPPEELVLVMDADTTLAPQFIEVALQRLESDPGLGAVGAVFKGTEPTSWLEQAQSNEWLRYARQLKRTGKVQVLSGTAALIRMSALTAVMEVRGDTLPGVHGDVYNRNAATEDFCLTVALKTLGYRLASPAACQTTTEVMPSYSMLWAQRRRWYGGALQVLATFGMSKATLPYFGQQFMLALGVLAMVLYLGFTTMLGVSGQLHLSAYGLIGVIFWLERVVTVWNGSRRARLLAMAFIPEILYEMYLQAAFVASVYRHLRGASIEWKHVSLQAAE